MSRKRHKSCGGKRRFRDAAEARRVLHKLGARSTREKVPVRVYECHRCGGFHLTSREFRP